MKHFEVDSFLFRKKKVNTFRFNQCCTLNESSYIIKLEVDILNVRNFQFSYIIEVTR